ncbi:MAG: Aldo/keto reductase family protein [Chthonomonadaceae bacterium]|nr:Aldo/keto reductase family protein [Chthonomonadaceae bacterium]
MRYNRFGNTDLEVSEIGLGCARLGGIMAQNQSRSESPENLLRQALDAGITFFDTADMYTQGESETLIGKAFAGKRDKVVIASKGGYCLPTQRKLIARIKPLIRPLVRALGLKRQNLPASVAGSMSQDFSPDYLGNAVEASLRRLKTDYLDLYQLHSPPQATIRSGEFVGTLEKLKNQGKIRYYGVAVDTVEDAVCCLDYPEISSVMLPFGLLDLEALDTFFVPAEARQLAVITRGCFGGGLLSLDLAPQQLQEKTPKWREILKFRQLAEQNGRSVLELALQFSQSLRPISLNLLGMRTEAHLQTNLKYLAAPPLSDAEFAAVASANDWNHLRDLAIPAP